MTLDALPDLDQSVTMTRTEWVDIAQVAELAGVKVPTIYQHRKRGTMPEPDARLGGVPVWKRRTIEKWIATRPSGGRPRKHGSKP